MKTLTLEDLIHLFGQARFELGKQYVERLPGKDKILKAECEKYRQEILERIREWRSEQ